MGALKGTFAKCKGYGKILGRIYQIFRSSLLVAVRNKTNSSKWLVATFLFACVVAMRLHWWVKLWCWYNHVSHPFAGKKATVKALI